MHQYLQMHILSRIVADVPPIVRMISPVPPGSAQCPRTARAPVYEGMGAAVRDRRLPARLKRCPPREAAVLTEPRTRGANRAPDPRC
jgi:hypothetical protein